ncbi:TPA: hypothetical protein QHS21_002908 [Klebsiella michiganensis]|nr:hypothetical protein [Klebsiella michiganensis]
MLTTENMKGLFLTIQTSTDSLRIATTRKAAGMKGYSYHVVTGNIALYDQQDEQQLLPGRLHAPQLIAPQPDPARLTWALEMYQLRHTRRKHPRTNLRNHPIAHRHQMLHTGRFTDISHTLSHSTRRSAS